MKEFIRKIWDAIVGFICKVPYDKWLHFIFGMIASSFMAIVFNEPFCLFLAIFFAIAKEMFDAWTTGKWDWWDFAATCFGGLVPQIFVIIRLLCF